MLINKKMDDERDVVTLTSIYNRILIKEKCLERDAMTKEMQLKAPYCCRSLLTKETYLEGDAITKEMESRRTDR